MTYLWVFIGSNKEDFVVKGEFEKFTDLFEDFVDINSVRFLALGFPLLASFFRRGLGSLDGLS